MPCTHDHVHQSSPRYTLWGGASVKCNDEVVGGFLGTLEGHFTYKLNCAQPSTGEHFNEHNWLRNVNTITYSPEQNM